MSIVRKICLFILTAFVLAACQKETVENLRPPVANAGNLQVIQLPANNITLTGSGTSENGAIVAYLWSLVSGPNVPVIQSPGSPVTGINNLVAGTYIFQLMVTDAAGLTGADTSKMTVSAAPLQTLTLQPGNNTANELNFAVNGNTNVSSHDIDLDAEAWTSGGNPFLIRGAFKFDLSTIPTTATIVSARLSLYTNPTPINGDQINANSGNNNAMFIRRITAPWSGLTATWQTQPATTTTNQLSIPHTSLSVLDLVDQDVTSMVSAMLGSNNNGFMMMLQNETAFNTRQFCSSNHVVAAKRPKLVVVYQ